MDLNIHNIKIVTCILIFYYKILKYMNKITITSQIDLINPRFLDIFKTSKNKYIIYRGT